MNRLVVLTALLFGTNVATADTLKFSGGILLTLCESPYGTIGQTECGIYMRAFEDGYFTAKSDDESYKSDLICLPDYITAAEIISVFVRTAKANARNEKFAKILLADPQTAVAATLARVYPCGGKQ